MDITTNRPAARSLIENENSILEDTQPCITKCQSISEKIKLISIPLFGALIGGATFFYISTTVAPYINQDYDQRNTIFVSFTGIGGLIGGCIANKTVTIIKNCLSYLRYQQPNSQQTSQEIQTDNTEPQNLLTLQQIREQTERANKVPDLKQMLVAYVAEAKIDMQSVCPITQQHLIDIKDPILLNEKVYSCSELKQAFIEYNQTTLPDSRKNIDWSKAKKIIIIPKYQARLYKG